MTITARHAAVTDKSPLMRTASTLPARLARRYRAAAVALGLAIAALAIHVPAIHVPATCKSAAPVPAVGISAAAAPSTRYQLPDKPASHTGP
jgi:hypothetical protein